MTDFTATRLCPACGGVVHDTGPRFIDRLSGVRYHPMCLFGTPRMTAVERVRPAIVAAEIAPQVEVLPAEAAPRVAAAVHTP